MQALILFPHQLFHSNVRLVKSLGRVFLVEDALYFTQYRFHKQKLVLHRASMRAHAELLRRHCRTDYIEAEHAGTMRAVFKCIKDAGVVTLHFIDVVDDWLERRLEREANTSGIVLKRHQTPMFMSGEATLAKHFAAKQPAMSRFYSAQRIEHDILMHDKQPVGGKWSFDADNRKRLPRGVKVPVLQMPAPSAHVAEAQQYVEQRFAGNPGQVDPFFYPINHAEASNWLGQFIHERLEIYGVLAAEIYTDYGYLFHSVLTPMLNIGLLTPRQVIDAALAQKDTTPLNSLEGFIRQVLGWREYVRGAYIYKGRAQRTSNFWKHMRALPQSFWRASVQIAPIDMVIDRVLRCAYAHHIERLMLLSTFMSLCEFHPDHVYRWFMEMFIDSYDWVMVPNVYGMGLYADGGRITTKPYICGSNYILKMSDLPAGPWCTVWDGLYWRFVAKHRDYLATNHRLQMTVRALDRMAPERRESHLAAAEHYLSQL